LPLRCSADTASGAVRAHGTGCVHGEGWPIYMLESTPAIFWHYFADKKGGKQLNRRQCLMEGFRSALPIASGSYLARIHNLNQMTR
jgi:hypothetical protein